MAAVRSHSLSVGIVGLPNSGKSTIFNALTKSAVPAENYPFCTIDKNIGVIKIDDQRLDRLAELYHAKETVPSAMTFVDIAGLVKGSSKGEGLGNMFLAHIREVDAVLYVLRAFRSEDITHVYDRVDPVDDLQIVRSELIFKDLETIGRRRDDLRNKAKAGISSELETQIGWVEKVYEGLNNEVPAANIEMEEDAAEYLEDLWLLTAKPAMYLLNIKGETDLQKVDEWRGKLVELLPEADRNFVVAVDCRMEVELEDLGKDERDEMISLMMTYKGVRDIVGIAFRRLNLVTFYTGNEKMVNAWTIRSGATVKDAAGVIHTELEERFVAAEVVAVEQLISAGGWNQSKEKGIVRNVGRDYVVQDGDYIVVLSQHS